MTFEWAKKQHRRQCHKSSMPNSRFAVKNGKLSRKVYSFKILIISAQKKKKILLFPTSSGWTFITFFSKREIVFSFHSRPTLIHPKHIHWIEQNSFVRFSTHRRKSIISVSTHKNKLNFHTTQPNQNVRFFIEANQTKHNFPSYFATLTAL